MDNNTDIINQPHVICFVNSRGALRACFAEGLDGTVDETYAVFPNRHAANLAISTVNDGGVDSTVYFSVPASALFTERAVTTTKFDLIRRFG